MHSEKMKNMIVLKNLPSNIVDEAIVILKPNVNIKNLNVIDSKKNKQKNEESKNKPRDYIVDEAQMVISNYITSIEKQKETKYRKMKKSRKKDKVLKTSIIALRNIVIDECLFNDVGDTYEVSPNLI